MSSSHGTSNNGVGFVPLRQLMGMGHLSERASSPRLCQSLALGLRLPKQRAINANALVVEGSSMGTCPEINHHVTTSHRPPQWTKLSIAGGFGCSWPELDWKQQPGDEKL